MAGVQEKLQIATAKLQQAIGSISGHLNTHNEKVKFVALYVCAEVAVACTS